MHSVSSLRLPERRTEAKRFVTNIVHCFSGSDGQPGSKESSSKDLPRQYTDCDNGMPTHRSSPKPQSRTAEVTFSLILVACVQTLQCGGAKRRGKLPVESAQRRSVLRFEFSDFVEPSEIRCMI